MHERTKSNETIDQGTCSFQCELKKFGDVAKTNGIDDDLGDFWNKNKPQSYEIYGVLWNTIISELIPKKSLFW